VNEISKKTCEVVTKMMKLMGEDVSVTCSLKEKAIFVEIATKEDAAHMIGKGGKVLEDFQFMVNRIIRRMYADREFPSVIVDIGGYRGEKEEELALMARDIAERVSKSGKSVLLRPMNAWERRIIHVTVKDKEGVYTESEDSSEGRRVRIKPEEEQGDGAETGEGMENTAKEE
jgi:spoIIIJ-associated protein